MTERSSMDPWQLQRSSEPSSQWQLLDTEQDLPSDLRLQEAPEPRIQEWQPIGYSADERQGGRNWFLPVFIIVALVAAVGYVAWLGISGFGGFGLVPPAQEANQPEMTPADPAVAALASPQVEPSPTSTATPLATPSPTPAPTLTPTPIMIEVQTAQVTSTYGVNLREAPSIDAAVIELLPNDATARVVGAGEDDWVELQLPDGRRGWASRRFLAFTTEMVPAPELAAGSVPTATTSLTLTQAITTVAPVTITVNTAGGVNARAAPNLDAAVITLLPQGAKAEVIGVSEDATWLQVRLDNGEEAWVLRELVAVNGDLTQLAPATPGEPLRVTAPTTSTAAVATTTLTATATVTGTGALTATTTATPTVIVDALTGVNARVEPNASAATAGLQRSGTALPALGRSADSDWIQVRLPDGKLAWVFAGSVTLNVDIATLPVVE